MSSRKTVRTVYALTTRGSQNFHGMRLLSHMNAVSLLDHASRRVAVALITKLDCAVLSSSCDE